MDEKRESEKSWHFDANTKQTPEPGKKYQLISPSLKDFQKVKDSYDHHPVKGYQIGTVEVIYNPVLNRRFSLQMDALQERDENPAFAAKWQYQENEVEWRTEINTLFQTLSKLHTDPDYPAVKLLPLWHGTKPETLDSVFRAGYASLATTDSGFFGKGLYSAHEAEYGVLLVSPNSAQNRFSQSAFKVNLVL